MFKRISLPILISGAGIAGRSLARQFRRAHIPFQMIEKKPVPTSEGAGIALPANAMRALRHLGLGDKIDAVAHKVHTIHYTDTKANILSTASLRQSPLDADRFTALHRAQLHEILREKSDDIHFDTTIEAIHQTDESVIVEFDRDIKQKKFSAVIGADGIHSRVRELVFGPQTLADLGVTTWRWTCNYPTEHLQPTYMLGLQDVFMAYPISPTEVYCYAHAFDPENIFSISTDHQKILSQRFGEYAGIAKILMQQLPANDAIIVGRLRSVSPPLFTSNRVALIGDAAHACSPLLQQGAASALEDVIALTELLQHFPIQTAFSHYATFRNERVQWTTQMSDMPLKSLVNMNETTLLAIQQKIRENGPLNVQGWKQLLRTDPIREIQAYIKQHLNISEISAYSPTTPLNIR